MTSSDPPGAGDAIVTPRLVLRPLAVADADEMAALLAAPELYVFIGGEPPDVESLRARYARLVVGRSADGTQQWFNWILRRREDAVAVGTVQATVTADGGDADVAWIVGLPWQGQGYATEAAVALVGRLTGRGVLRVGASVHPGHRASAAVARRAGLRPTGAILDGEERWLLHA